MVCLQKGFAFWLTAALVIIIITSIIIIINTDFSSLLLSQCCWEKGVNRQNRRNSQIRPREKHMLCATDSFPASGEGWLNLNQGLPGEDLSLRHAAVSVCEGIKGWGRRKQAKLHAYHMCLHVSYKTMSWKSLAGFSLLFYRREKERQWRGSHWWICWCLQPWASFPPLELFLTGRRSCLFGGISSTKETACKIICLKNAFHCFKTNFKKTVQTSMHSSIKLKC